MIDIEFIEILVIESFTLKQFIHKLQCKYVRTDSICCIRYFDASLTGAGRLEPRPFFRTYEVVQS